MGMTESDQSSYDISDKSQGNQEIGAMGMTESDQSSYDISDKSQEETIQDRSLEFSEDEEALIIRMFRLLGERWTLIAGRIPGRTAEEIKQYWATRRSTSFQVNE
ncbi:MYB-like transcription factor ETC1 isoform X1 [Amborella trichopoda]|uniref:Uncharacterized protein n=1 Tax=Amborella trichopoda TaxID=13333 RepID=U5D5X4_AMBTC|nr:MYB-like transcription factor ETC1 isoform X1 [Amborella trichopoda]ERN16832.1 hypothetical protein AMTR_s00057p00119300 [Amborella trichopoda]|eukprot:XP_006855365.1 MYB-like transcription factor ETC1 isoform X1 [Amborella trichopoda]